MKKYHYSVLLIIPVIVGVLLILCGVSLSLGFRTLSLVCFFAVLVLLVLMAVVRWFLVTGKKNGLT